MHGVIGMVAIDATRATDAEAALNGTVVPLTKQMAGFVSGTWLRSPDGTRGLSVLLFESEDAADAMASRMKEGPPPGVPVTFVSAEVFEVLAQA